MNASASSNIIAWVSQITQWARERQAIEAAAPAAAPTLRVCMSSTIRISPTVWPLICVPVSVGGQHWQQVHNFGSKYTGRRLPLVALELSG
jgi:hypothetical protein